MDEYSRGEDQHGIAPSGPGGAPPGEPTSGGAVQQPYREATLSAILFGLVFGAILNMAITYAGLKIGFTITGSSVAAVVGFGVLRGILRQGSILETNIGQTIASAVNSPNSGIIFTVPVLFLLGYQLTLGKWALVTLAAVVGAILGVAFIVPLRKQMIDIDRLRFPTGTAVAAILKSPGAGARKSLVLIVGIVVAALVYLPVELPNVKIGGKALPGYGDLEWRLSDPRPEGKGKLSREYDRDGDGKPDLIMTDGDINMGRWLGLPDYFLLLFAITPLSFGAGYLTGRAGLMVLAGGVLAFFVLNPVAYSLGWMPTGLPPDQAPSYGYSAFNRPLGIGMLLGSALMGVVVSLPTIREALRSVAVAGRQRREQDGNAGGSDELGLRVLILSVLGSVALLYVASYFTQSAESTGGLLSGLNPHVRSLIIALIGAGWIWFAGIIISQCTGMTDWSPISGMALLTVVLVMLLSGTGEVVGAVLLGAALCVATTGAADMMADLKTGYLVGGQPRRQQLLELSTSWLGPIISIGTLLLIVVTNQTKFGKPIGPGTDTVAPQAQALQAIIMGVQGGEMPYALYGLGALLGVLMGLGAFPGLGVLVGLSMYLPIKYILSYGVGCLVNMGVRATMGKHWAEEWGVPFCAGLIVGEALLALVVNCFILIQG